MNQKIIIARKHSEDPDQEHLREQKAIWNRSVTELISKIITFKRGLNGRADPRGGMPESNIKDPLPPPVGQYLNDIANNYTALVDGAEKIIQEQEHYSHIRRKEHSEIPMSADDGFITSSCPKCNNDMNYDDGRDAYVCHCGYIGENGPINYKSASNPLSRFWAANFGIKGEDRVIIKSMLRSAVSFRNKLLELENYLSSSDPNSIPRSLYIASSFGIGPYKNILQSFDKLKSLHGRELVNKQNLEKEKAKLDEKVKENANNSLPVDTKTTNSIQMMNNLVEIYKDIHNLQSVINYLDNQDNVTSEQKTILKSLKGAANKGSEISIYLNKLKEGLQLSENEINDAEKIILAYRKLLVMVAGILGVDALNFSSFAKNIQNQPIEAKAHNPISRFLKRKWLESKPDFIRDDVDIDMRKQITIDHISEVINSLENFMNVLEINATIDSIFKSLQEFSNLLSIVIEDIITLAEYHSSMFRNENRNKRTGVILHPIIEREINKLRNANIGIKEMSSQILIHRPSIGIIPV
jgi:hypothetical protein